MEIVIDWAVSQITVDNAFKLLFAVVVWLYGRWMARRLARMEEDQKVREEAREEALRRFNAEPIEVVLALSSDTSGRKAESYRFDPPVTIRRDELARGEILGVCGQAVGGQASGVRFPSVDRQTYADSKAGKANVVVLRFDDGSAYHHAVAMAEVHAGRREKPDMKPERKATPASQDDLRSLESRLKELVETKIEAVCDVVRNHTALLSQTRKLPAVDALEAIAGNGRKRR